MKRRSFFKKLGISGLVASVAPQIIQEVKADEPGGYVVPQGFIDEMHLYPIQPKNHLVVEELENAIQVEVFSGRIYQRVEIEKTHFDSIEMIELSVIENVYGLPIHKFIPRKSNAVEIYKPYTPDTKFYCDANRGIYYVESPVNQKWTMNGFDWHIKEGQNLFGPVPSKVSGVMRVYLDNEEVTTKTVTPLNISYQ